MAVPPTTFGQQLQSESKTAISSHAAPSPTAPQSPCTQNREQQRVTLLLEINNELLQEIDRLQGDGQGGVISQQQPQQLRNDGQPEKPASELYISTMRRVSEVEAGVWPHSIHLALECSRHVLTGISDASKLGLANAKGLTVH